jgi:hypothetical protein
MGIFDDGFFRKDIEEIFNQLAGEGYVEYSSTGPSGKKIYKRRGKNSFEKFFLKKINTEEKIYLIFDLSGKENILTEISKESHEKMLEVYEQNTLIFSFPLGEIKGKNMDAKFNNGILEVSFTK